MLQSYCAVAPCICIPRHFPLFNPALTLYCATGAYLRHAVGGGIPQPLHNCVSAGLRSGTPPRGFPFGAEPALRRGGDDDRRRAFPSPRQAVVAVRNPVFRHARSWRHAGRTKSPRDNATPEVVAGCPLQRKPR